MFPTEINQQEKKHIAHRINTFALSLYQQLKEQDGNLFLSPFSISTCLGVAYAGVRGETERQMADVIRFPPEQKNLHELLGSLIKDMKEEKKKRGYQLIIANALWGQKGYRFLPEFLELLRVTYGSELHELDFEAEKEAACQAINQWAEKHTQGKIKNIIKPSMLDSLTRLVLTNAIYFKGFWSVPFDKSETHPAPFKMITEPSASNEIDVSMMHQTADFGYLEGEDFQALEMLYERNELSMVIFLPRRLDGLEEFERLLTIEKFEEWLQMLQMQEVKVFVPKFKFTSGFILSKVLQSMGMTDVFNTETADFSGMTDQEDLAISEIIHKAFVDVNEEGTEAAAVTTTAVLVAVDEGPAPPVPVFRADHPFLFLIRDIRSESILFMGRVVDAEPLEKNV